jgi:hypothetical protein
MRGKPAPAGWVQSGIIFPVFSTPSCFLKDSKDFLKDFGFANVLQVERQIISLSV